MHRRICPAAQYIWKQLKEIIEDKNKKDRRAREVQEQVHCKDVLNPDTSSVVLNTLLPSMNNEIEHGCFD